MKLIAHRGLINGPDKNFENSPNQINTALSLGYDCEIDIWKCDDKLFLGHDLPQYEIDLQFLSNENFWIHAKNLEALHFLLSTNLNYFWHQTDDFTLTSRGFIWAYPGKELTEKSIMVMPELISSDFQMYANSINFYGICSDYVGIIK